MSERATRVLFVLLALALGLAAPTPAAAQRDPHGGIFRFPDVSATHVVFVYADDLWIVPREGGTATALASPEGVESFPRFSPDGSSVAFVGAYEAGPDIYTLPTAGGVPARVTYFPGEEYLADWTADGRLLFSMRGLHGLGRVPQIFTVSPRGGLPERLGVPYGMFPALHPDGTRLVYQPRGVARQNWKRYRGGQAPDLWLYDLAERTSQRITDWEGSDGEAMWHGEKIYYVSDAGPAHRQNVWVHDLASGGRRQVTHFVDADVRMPSMGPGPDGQGEIVFQEGTGLRLLDLATETVRTVDVIVPGARPELMRQTFDAAKTIQGWNVSPTGKRAVVAARGDIWTLPAKDGPPRNLTRTDGIAEREPAWSPDGRWVAFFSDATGEYELWTTRADGTGQARPLTTGGDGWRFEPQWSPDSTRIAFTDKASRIFVHVLSTGETVLVDQDPVVEEEGADAVSWSPDGRWLGYARSDVRERNKSVYLWDANTQTSARVTSGMYDDRLPTFDRRGDWLYYVSRRAYSPRYGDQDDTFIYGKTGVLVAAGLRKDVASPYVPTSDEEPVNGTPGGDEDAAESASDGELSDGERVADDGISGTWEGTARQDELLPPGGVTFTLILFRDAEGTLSGSFSTPIGGASVTGGSYDAEAGRLRLSFEDEEGLAWTIEGTVRGETVQGTATQVSAGMIVEFEARRTARPSPGDEAASRSTSAKTSPGASKPVVLDLEDFERRAFVLPVKPGIFTQLAVNHEGALLYSRHGVRGSGEDAVIQRFSPSDAKKEEQEVAKGASAFRLSADGKRLLVVREKSASLQPAGPGSGRPVPTAGMQVRVRPRHEWRQVLTDAWRVMRDYFYDPHMHGVDWPAAKTRYLEMVEACVTRDDLAHLIREMIGELNVGHANHWVGRPWERGGGPATGMLGVDWSLENGAWRIRRIVKGAPWDVDVRGPLEMPGVDAREGDYLLAVNGVPVDPQQAPWAAFEGLAGKTVVLTLSTQPTPGDEARSVIVKPEGNERSLRYRAWIEKNRRTVDEATAGRVGYLYVPNTGWRGQNELMRQLQAQLGKDALIIDERWNGGGQIPDRFVELLNRPIRNYWARRDGIDWPWPHFAHQGPKCMLMNGNSGSGGDAFPHYFRESGLGKLVGMRTWGGLVGMSGNPGLIDGSYVSAPTFAFYEKDGTWGIEGHGVDPDIEVLDDPARMVDGGDPQLEAAIQLMLEELKTGTYAPPKRPAYPNRAGMGLAPEDR